MWPLKRAISKEIKKKGEERKKTVRAQRIKKENVHQQADPGPRVVHAGAALSLFSAVTLPRCKTARPSQHEPDVGKLGVITGCEQSQL